MSGMGDRTIRRLKPGDILLDGNKNGRVVLTVTETRPGSRVFGFRKTIRSGYGKNFTHYTSSDLKYGKWKATGRRCSRLFLSREVAAIADAGW